MSRLTELDEFKHWLCNLNQSPFHLEDDDGSIQFRPNLGTKGDDDKQQNLSTSKVNLMENMAQLWLQQEVKDLEGHEELYSPYLVIDHLGNFTLLFILFILKTVRFLKYCYIFLFYFYSHDESHVCHKRHCGFKKICRNCSKCRCPTIGWHEERIESQKCDSLVGKAVPIR